MAKRGPRPIMETHPDRARIEYDLARGVPIRVIGAKYGVAKNTACRWKSQLPPQLRAAAYTAKITEAADLEALRIDESNALLQNLATQRARLLLAQDQALELTDHRMLVSISGQIHKNIELVGRYLGEFAQHSVSTNINVLIQPEYLELRSKIVRALAPFPEARAAVAAVLHSIEGRAAAHAQPQPPAPVPPMLEGRANAA